MKRTQIQLTEEQYKLLKKISSERDESIAEIIRESISYYTANKCLTDDKGKKDNAINAIGKYHSGFKDAAEKHDRYLTEDFSKWEYL